MLFLKRTININPVEDREELKKRRLTGQQPQPEVKGNMSQFTARSQADGRWRHARFSHVISV